MEFWHLEQKKKRNCNPILSFLLLLLTSFGSVHILAQTTTTELPSDITTEYANLSQSHQNMVDTSLLPVITSLSSRNREFAQYMQNVEKSYQNISAGRNFQPGFYLYTVTADDTSLPVRNLVSLAARCSVPYGEIALLNDLTSAEEDLTGKTLILPDAPGLFVPLNPATSIGTLVKKRLSNPDFGNEFTINGKSYQYFPQERLTPTELAFFLDTNLRMPLDNSVLTSGFGNRVSPITGLNHQHKGIDLAAPEGTKVYACKGGTVAIASYDMTYGNYIILDHENKTQSVYAHLSAMLVKTGEEISRGAVIGKVGSTGASTGPHLHFEIRVNGAAQDPRRLLPAI